MDVQNGINLITSLRKKVIVCTYLTRINEYVLMHIHKKQSTRNRHADAILVRHIVRQVRLKA